MEFSKKLETKDVRFGVVGLGYVGLPLAVEFANENFKVTGIDIDESKVNKLKNGENYISDVNDDELKRAVKNGYIKATTDFSVIKDLDFISICVPTPLNKLKDPDMSFIQNSMTEITKYLHKDLVIVLESTTYPGTTKEFLLPILEETGLKVGKDIYLAFSPERVDPGNKIYKTKNTPKVLGGITSKCTEYSKKVYDQVFDKVVPVSSAVAAEMTKLLENTFRMINIGLVNEMAMVCDKLGVDVWEVIDAAATKPFGFMKFYPGPGLGGHCIPIDPHYLSWKMKSLNYKTRFIDLAAEINTAMPEYVIQNVSNGLNHHKKSINGSSVLLIGMAYKKNIEDLRESPSIDIYNLLVEKGAKVNYHDPYCPIVKVDGNSELKTKKMTTQLLHNSDVVVITTDHSNIDYQFIVDNAKLVVDTRNVTKKLKHTKNKVLKLGFLKGIKQ
ncbi:MAG: nucleotide sugar dehydrogenase [Candidatus Marinimicrobia bacterium]|jgi:UDP-N-acetyl-D-glucosamine dehydrogenase|nr:nucleotide sugar dehydrogenase [Candidatus Neomarinimicrobiota bacterium]